MKKISVVIPTYKRIGLLQKCLHRLVNQSFPAQDFEVIVVSDGPDEPTEHLLSSQFPNVKFNYLDEKKGPAAARNVGWLMASAPLIAFTDDDCLPDTRWLEEIWNAYNGEDLVAFSGKVEVPVSPKPTDFELNTAHLATAEFITANCVCTKRALVKTGGFDDRFALAWREDSDLHFKLITHQIPVRKIEALVTHPVRVAKMGVSVKEQKKGLYNALLYKKFPQLYRRKIGYGAPWYYYAIVFCFAAMLFELFRDKNFLAVIFAGCWISLTLYFCWKRIRNTSKSFSHITEMAFTSILIPFLSVFWQFYGSVKYRVLFI